jgi:hypothetical protein
MTARHRSPAAPALALAIALAFAGCAAAPDAGSDAPAWRELFDGKELGSFAVTDFGGQGEVAVQDGRLLLGMGSPLTGVTWTGATPAGSYELEVVAARLDGGDFFCGLTFPVGQDHLTLVLGGWGGSLCGLSSLDGNDAAHNDTRCLRQFPDGKECTVRVAVAPDRVEATLDGQPLCRIDPRRHRLGLRPEVALCRPLGLASFHTVAAVRSVRWRPLAVAAGQP